MIDLQRNTLHDNTPCVDPEAMLLWGQDQSDFEFSLYKVM